MDLKLAQTHYLVLNFYQINKDSEIQIFDHLVIKALIPCQRTILTPKLKLLGEVPRYDLYYFLTISNTYTNLQIDINKILGYVCFPEFTFREIIFQTFLCLFAIRKVGQWKTLSSKRKI